MLCDRTREWVALRLDGELSDFEQTLMDSHLERCGSCRAFSGEVTVITNALRAAPFELPSQAIQLPTRRRLLPPRRLQLAAAAALVVLAAGVGGLYGALHGSPAPGIAGPVVHAPMIGYTDESMQLRQIRLAELKPSGPLPLGATKPPLDV